MTRRNTLGVALLLLLLMFGLALTSMAQKSPTFDEQGFITRGLAYLRRSNRHMRVGHPLGLNALNAAFLVDDETVRLPTDHPSWQETSFHRPSELFLWEIGNDVAHVMFLARLPTLWLGMLLAAVTGRWAYAISRRREAGVLALALVALDPNVLAHTRLATTDLGLAFGAALAGFTLWRFLHRPTWPNVVIAGVALGLLMNTKFTAGLFIPLFALVILLALFARWRRTRSISTLQPPITKLIIYPIIGILTLWAANGFDVATLPDTLPTLAALGGRTLPLAHYLEQLLDIGGRLQQGTPSFLLGHYSNSGWWYYFPVAFLLKTPLPTLLLLGWAAARAVRGRWQVAGGGSRVARGKRVALAALLVPALGYVGFALTTDINLGYRHLLPVLPFLYAFTGVSVASSEWQVAGEKWARTAVTLLPATLLLATLLIYPHFLAYFNVLGGGPAGGWRALVDSNLDWGQDLGNLANWLHENDVDHVYLSYFGEARPGYYAIPYTGLDSFPPRLMNPAAQPIHPQQPPPGTYAISATNLQGVHFRDHDRFAWFRRQEPVAKIGYSIFIYDVAAGGPPAGMVLSGVQLPEITPDDYAQLGTNDVTARWFDAGESLLIPAGQTNWLALGDDVTTAAAFAPLVQSITEPVADGPGYILARFRPGTQDALTAFLADWTAANVTLTQKPGRVTLVATHLPRHTVEAGSSFTLLTAWQQLASPRPVRIFVHLLGAGGRPIAQWDGLGAVAAGWRQGDVLLQTHTLTVPEDTPAGTYSLVAGLYHPDTGTRWQTPTGDTIPLGEITLP